MSNSAAAEEPPHKKGKTSPPPSSSWSSPLSSLPDEMVLNCLARVSRSDQAALSLVSKNYRSVITSPEFYNTRSLLGCAENCVYVCLLTPPDPTPMWFILRKGKTGNRHLRPIPSFPHHPTEGSSVVALDRGIYLLGGRINRRATAAVRLLDCRTHTWRKLPSMAVPRSSAAAGVVNGKIYVYGGCPDADSPYWAEVFDPKTETWHTLPPMPDRMMRGYIHDSVVVKEEKVYGVGVRDDTFYYSPSEDKWGRGFTPPRSGNRRDWCLIDKNLIFCIDRYGNLCWCKTEQLECFETEGMTFWKEVKGLGSLNETLCRSRLVQFDMKFEAKWESYKITIGVVEKLVDLFPGARLSSNNSGSNVVLFWDVVEGDHLEIWCAEVSLERRNQGAEIWGNILWSNAVMTVDPFLHHYKVLHSVSVTF